MPEFSDLPRDTTGNIITNPVKSWLSGPVQNTAVLMAVDYLADQGQSIKVFTMILTPAQALDMAASLNRHANAILGQQTPPRSQQS